MPDATHLKVLDGWRGISILFVLIAHLVPLGHPANNSFGILGMVLFFNLSGFLITSFLLKKQATVTDFLIRRFFRIIPLAWLYLLIVLIWQDESLSSWIAHFLFYANLPPKYIHLATDHLWSLCVEVQFYVGIALLFAIFKGRGLLLLPILGVGFTLFRIANQVYVSSFSYYRIDEILAGCTLALLYHGQLGLGGKKFMVWMKLVPQWPLFFLLVFSCLSGIEYGQWFNYFRPYLSALLIGATLLSADTSLVKNLNRRSLKYLAEISFALYVIHIGLTYTWLGSGPFSEKYLKRPLLLAVLFLLAHLSTFWYEHPAISWGKSLSARLSRHKLARAAD